MSYTSERILSPAREQPPECQGCPLSGQSVGFAIPEGTGSNGVICVAERLGEHEAIDGLPLRPQAAAGSIFERICRQLGVSRSEFKILNVINCLIPHKDLRGQPYEYGAIEHCRVHRDHVLLNHPDKGVGYEQKVILAMGDISMRTLTGLSGRENSIDKLRGYPIETPYGLVLGTYNPAKILHESKLLGVLKQDIQRALDIAQDGWHPPVVRYQERPTVEQAWDFYNTAKQFTFPLIACDIENDFSETEHWVKLTSVQFSLGKNTGIFLDATPEFRPVIKAILALKAEFWFHNGWRHDQPILTTREFFSKGQRVEVRDPLLAVFGGPVEDSLWAFHHAQPDLTTQESEDGLGISSKMGLQYVASLYGFPRRWKHLNKANPRYYGICDVDALQYIVPGLKYQLREKGMWDSYQMHVARYDPIMQRITERGIPVHESTRLEVRKKLEGELDTVAEEIQGIYPAELKNIEPKKGYTVVPKPKEGVIRWNTLKPPEWFDKDDKVWRAMELRLFKGLNLKKKVDCDCFTILTHGPDKQTAKGVTPGKPYKKPKKVYMQDCPLCAGKKRYTQVSTEAWRWVKVLPFRPSKDQIIKYMRFRKHPVPTKRGPEGRRIQTTEYKELEKLAIKYKDPLYGKTVEYRKLEKIIATYIDGWKPLSDGSVHPVYLGSTATGQLASEAPNALNPPKHNERLANQFRSMIIAPPGHTFIEMDYKSYHGATLAAESGDEVYYKIAVKVGDAHSFLASYLVKEPIDPLLSIEELKDRCAYIKKKHKQVRNTSAKQANLGYGFGMQGPGLYERYAEYFENRPCAKHYNKPCGHACEVIHMLDLLYERNKRWRDSQVEEAYRNGGKSGGGWLLSKYFHIRWFNSIYTYRRQPCTMCDGQPGYDYSCWVCKGKGGTWERRNGGDMEDIYAFKPANHAHCNFKEVQIRLDDRGLLEKYQLILPYHDALYFCCLDELVEEAIHEAYLEMIKPIVVLAHPTLCPGGLVVDVDVNVGKSWDKMTNVKVF